MFQIQNFLEFFFDQQIVSKPMNYLLVREMNRGVKQVLI